jgi:hypothetical protein
MLSQQKQKDIKTKIRKNNIKDLYETMNKPNKQKIYRNYSLEQLMMMYGSLGSITGWSKTF